MKSLLQMKKGVTLVDILLGVLIFSMVFALSVNSIKHSVRFVTMMQNYINIYAFMKEIGDSVMDIQDMDDISTSKINHICDNVKTTHKASKFLQSLVVTPAVTFVKRQIKSPKGLQIKKVVITFSWESAVNPANSRQLIIFRSGLGAT